MTPAERIAESLLEDAPPSQGELRAHIGAYWADLGPSRLVDDPAFGSGRAFEHEDDARKYAVAAELVTGMKADFKTLGDATFPFFIRMIPV